MAILSDSPPDYEPRHILTTLTNNGSGLSSSQRDIPTTYIDAGGDTVELGGPDVSLTLFAIADLDPTDTDETPSLILDWDSGREDVRDRVLVLSAPDAEPVISEIGTGAISEQFIRLEALADFTGDGIPDLVGFSDAGEVWLLDGDGDGNFSEVSRTPTDNLPASGATADFHGSAGQLASLQAVDFNGNGQADLVLTLNYHAPGSSEGEVERLGVVQVMLGDGTGNFPTSTSYPLVLGTYLDGSFSFELGGDRLPDLLVRGRQEATPPEPPTPDDPDAEEPPPPVGEYLSLALPNQSETNIAQPFAGGIPFQSVFDIDFQELVTEDINGDGIDDQIIVNRNSVSVALGNGDGSFRHAFGATAKTPQLEWLAADLDNNQYPDLVGISNALEGDDGRIGSLTVLGSGGNLPELELPEPGGLALVTLTYEDKFNQVTSSTDEVTFSPVNPVGSNGGFKKAS